MKLLTSVSFLALFFLVTQPASAQGLNNKDMYFGGGFNQNDTSGADDATGFQFFGGYDLPVKVPNGKLSLEVGYWDSGDFDVVFFGVKVGSASANGIWATGVYSLPISKTVDLLGRAGFDFGDDDGLMVGIGVGFKLNRQMQIRGEFVSRDTIDSLQANFVYHM
jgi:hypothetical protein